MTPPPGHSAAKVAVSTAAADAVVRYLAAASAAHAGSGGREDAQRLARSIGEVADGLLKFLSDHMPEVERWLLEGLDTVFAPRLLLRHLVAAMVLQGGLVAWDTLLIVGGKLMSRLTRKHAGMKACRQRMAEARSYEEWRSWAEKLDELEGHDVWRARPDSLLYDHKVLQKQIDELNAMVQRDDAFGLIFTLRGSLSRNKHGVLHEGLFTRAHAGTKLLVERYHDMVVRALYFVKDYRDTDNIPTDAKLAFFNETRHAYGRTALMLSGGAAMGFYHVGVIKALMECRLLPRVISGASAGSIVAAMVGTRTDAELWPMYSGNDIVFEFFRPMRESERRARAAAAGNRANMRGGPTKDKLKTEAFWQLLVPPQLRWVGDLLWSGLLGKHSVLKMDTEYFRSVMKHNIGTLTFQEAFDRTGRIVNITVAPRNRTDPPRLLNYLTAPHVQVWSAAVCSSSVPGVFDPSTLLVKQADGSVRPEYSATEKFVDGSMEADLPMQQLSELFNINHFIVSQVNPHATLLSTMSLPKSVWKPPLYRFLVGLVSFLRAQVRNWFRNVIEFVSVRRMAPVWATRRGGIQLLTQEYEGRHQDITITPWEGKESVASSFLRMLTNPTKAEFCEMVAVSERNTWPQMEMIRCHCAVEMALEQCVQALRKQVTLENHSRLLGGPPSRSIQASNAAALRGRVPSFYTSRSIVNLSGLNVLDPSVVLQQRPSFGSRASLGGDSAISEENGGGGGGGGNDVGLSMEVPLPFQIPINDSQMANGGGHGSSNALSGFNDQQPPGQSPHVLPGPLQHLNSVGYGGPGSNSGVAARQDGFSPAPSPLTPSMVPNAALEEELGGMVPPANVVKSTSMANFYYRAEHGIRISKSWDGLGAAQPSPSPSPAAATGPAGEGAATLAAPAASDPPPQGIGADALRRIFADELRGSSGSGGGAGGGGGESSSGVVLEEKESAKGAEGGGESGGGQGSGGGSGAGGQGNPTVSSTASLSTHDGLQDV